jgi:alkylated DNA nucleotide flippase Atl1
LYKGKNAKARYVGQLLQIIPYQQIPDDTDKKENQIFRIVKDIQKGAVATSYMRNGLLIYVEMCKYLTIYEEAVSHI